MNYWERARREKEGVAHIVPAFPEWVFYVRRCSTWAPDFQRAIARIAAQPENVERVKRISAPGYVKTDADAEADEQHIMEAFAEGCVARWDGVTDPNGNALELNTANVVAVLAAFPEIYSSLMLFARDEKNFEPIDTAAKEEIATGNLSPASNSSRVRGGITSGSSRSATTGAARHRRSS